LNETEILVFNFNNATQWQNKLAKKQPAFVFE